MERSTRTTLELITAHATMLHTLAVSLRRVASPTAGLSYDDYLFTKRVAANIEEAATDLFAIGEPCVEI